MGLNLAVVMKAGPVREILAGITEEVALVQGIMTAITKAKTKDHVSLTIIRTKLTF